LHAQRGQAQPALLADMRHLAHETLRVVVMRMMGVRLVDGVVCQGTLLAGIIHARQREDMGTTRRINAAVAAARSVRGRACAATARSSRSAPAPRPRRRLPTGARATSPAARPPPRTAGSTRTARPRAPSPTG